MGFGVQEQVAALQDAHRKKTGALLAKHKKEMADVPRRGGGAEGRDAAGAIGANGAGKGEVEVERRMKEEKVGFMYRTD